MILKLNTKGYFTCKDSTCNRECSRSFHIHFVPVGPTCCSNCKGSDKLRIKRMLAKVLLFAYVLSTLFMYIATLCPILEQLNCLHIKRVCNSQFDWLCIADA